MAVGGYTRATWKNGRPLWFPEELDWIVGGIYKGHPEALCEVRNLIGPNMSFRRQICKQVGYMRSELGALGSGSRAGDETEFYMRAKHCFPDSRVVYEPKAIVRHKTYLSQSSVGHLVKRSYSDGYHKSKTSKVFASSSKNPFVTEMDYLQYLLYKSIPWRLLRFYRLGSLWQVGAILLSILSFGIGYLRGKV